MDLNNVMILTIPNFLNETLVGIQETNQHQASDSSHKSTNFPDISLIIQGLKLKLISNNGFDHVKSMVNIFVHV